MATNEKSDADVSTPMNGSEMLQSEMEPAEAGAEAPARTADGSGRMMPGSPGFLSGIVYRAAYGLSYGVVFPVALLARAIPRDNAMVHGLVDGAMAARDMILGGRRDAPALDQSRNGPMPAAMPA